MTGRFPCAGLSLADHWWRMRMSKQALITFKKKWRGISPVQGLPPRKLCNHCNALSCHSQRLQWPIFSSEFLPKFLPKFYPKKHVITTFATKKVRNHDICDKKVRNHDICDKKKARNHDICVKKIALSRHLRQKST